MLPFSRIAVFPPDLVFGPELPHAFEKEETERFKSWVHGAVERGADAWYARVDGLETRVALDLVNYYARNLAGVLPYVLLPQALRGATFRGYTALHCKDGEEKPSPFRGQAPDLLFGKSCHSLDSVLRAQKEGFDYVFLSPVYSTKTHPEAKPLGIEELREVSRLAKIPVFALGGLNEAREAVCLKAGAAGIAGIGMFFTPKNSDL